MIRLGVKRVICLGGGELSCVRSSRVVYAVRVRYKIGKHTNTARFTAGRTTGARESLVSDTLRRQNARLGRHHNPTHVALETLKAAMLLPHSTCVQGSALAPAPWAHTGLHCGTRKRPGLQVCSASGPSGDSRPGSRPLSRTPPSTCPGSRSLSQQSSRVAASVPGQQSSVGWHLRRSGARARRSRR